MTVVEEYLQCLGAHDWEGLARTIVDEGLHRDGPFCDVIEGQAAYVKFLEQIVDSLPNYVLKVARMSPISDRLVYVELSETFDVKGVSTEYPECIVFETAEDGLIRDVSVFMKYPGAEAP
ncbi:MAG TPA: nuclear transport factor 2 family protein, partial [Acidimicrobiales bacterium]|nr:nuclear transport factor 2 family protein [Acidimicrobiales bacterium]